MGIAHTHADEHNAKQLAAQYQHRADGKHITAIMTTAKAGIVIECHADKQSVREAVKLRNEMGDAVRAMGAAPYKMKRAGSDGQRYAVFFTYFAPYAGWQAHGGVRGKATGLMIRGSAAELACA